MAASPATVWQPWARLVDRVPWHRVRVGCALGALVTSMALHDPITSWWLTVYGMFTAAIFVAGGYERPHGAVIVGVGIIVGGLAAAAIRTQDAGNATLLMWTSMAVPFAFVRPAILSDTLRYALPFVVLHGALLVASGWSGAYRPSGLVVNPNPAAALLAIAAIALVARGYVWAALPFVYALAFTGSRWATVVLAIVLALLWLRGSRWPIALMLAVAAVALLPHSTQLAEGYRLTAENETTVTDDLVRRTSTEGNVPAIQPKGVAHIEGLHAIYLRVSYEAGLLAGLAWAALTFLAVRWGRGAWKWLAVAFALLGFMDYYAWQIGTLAVLWWATVALTVRSPQES